MVEDHDRPVAWVEHHTHPDEKVTIIERFVPAEAGEYAPFLFRQAGTGHYVSMKLVSRRLVGAPLPEPGGPQ
jgi:hypothetical protein